MTDSLLRILILVLVFAAVLLLVEVLVGGYLRARSRDRSINQRLQLIGRGQSRADAFSTLRRHNLDIVSRVPAPFKGTVRKLERMLLATGLLMPTGRLLLLIGLAPVILIAAIVVVMLAAGAPIGAGRLLLVSTISILIGTFFPLMILSRRAQKRRKKMQEQFPVALDVFVRGLRAGHPVAAALDLLTVEMPDPIGSQFGLVVDEVTYGAELRDSLSALAERWDLDDMRMFVVSLSVQNETGGNLAEILENLSRVIRDRQSMLMKVRALSSEGRMTGVILTLLPVATFSGLFLINAKFYLEVADDPLFVPGFLGLILLYCIGFFSIRRLVDLKV
ncbi:tight adherence protein B [Sphingomonas kaistensis]|uniref:Tight adherence protein B n=1 Tax=Sphingomonas kaistensis TaxID=298708 RepID=A0A7X5Y7G4_9SPHN|nr:type II secretion system F family protein [Sphingomonas kaistensis]NJC06629.1 tight adherence protein B [Sphingomonas kaistensis]